MNDKFYELLDRTGFVFLDGGFGTMLQATGVEIGHNPELLNRSIADCT